MWKVAQSWDVNGGERFGSRMKYARVKKNMHAFEMLAMTAGGGVGWGGVGCGWGGGGGQQCGAGGC